MANIYTSSSSLDSETRVISAYQSSKRRKSNLQKCNRKNIRILKGKGGSRKNNYREKWANWKTTFILSASEILTSLGGISIDILYTGFYFSLKLV